MREHLSTWRRGKGPLHQMSAQSGVCTRWWPMIRDENLTSSGWRILHTIIWQWLGNWRQGNIMTSVAKNMQLPLTKKNYRTDELIIFLLLFSWKHKVMISMGKNIPFIHSRHKKFTSQVQWSSLSNNEGLRSIHCSADEPQVRSLCILGLISSTGSWLMCPKVVHIELLCLNSC